MKSGVRALGIAESYRTDQSTLAGVLTRADRVVDGFVFGSCTVGGTDATATICNLYRQLNREDIQYLLVSGIAPAWYNIVDLHRLHEVTGRPILSVSFEESDGLESSIRAEFDDEKAQKRLDIYRSLPDREEVTVEAGTLFCRAVGLDSTDPAEVVRTFTDGGRRPEPLRVARLAARAGDAYRRADET